MKISQNELTFLIENAENYQPVQVSFGIHGACLRALPENSWAIELVKAARRLVKQRAKGSTKRKLNK